ncbi:LysR family transcriptional regulator [Paenibacillus vortex]|uniref:LysR family transcriptional regulator n=1 Tax=Paenibacillus vortex TaxID=71995 RepID=UPI0003178511
MELIYLQTFKEVADRQSFTKAAEELGYAQSSVTTQIQKLEKEYGVKLFERYGKGLRLTKSGEELLKYAVQMLDLFQQSKEKLTKQGGGTVIDRDHRLVSRLFSSAGRTSAETSI